MGKGDVVFMEKELLQFMKEKTQELVQSPTCCAELKEVAATWLEAVGTENEAAETEKYMNELKADIMPIDQLIGFAGSETGEEYFGQDAAQNIKAHAEEIKENGSCYCDCPACAAAEAILKKLAAL